MQFIVLGFQIAILIVGGILGGMGLGFLVDKYLGSSPWGMIAGIILGIFLGGAGVYKIINRKE